MSFPAYPSYKDSSDSFLGDIPSHWSVKRVRSVADVINGYPFDSVLFDENFGHPLIRIRDLNSSETATKFNGPFLPEAAVTNADILIGMDGDFNVGNWRGSTPALLNQRMCCVRTADGALSRFLFHLLPFPLKAINDVTYSTTVKHLSSFQVEKLRIALPGSDEELSAIVEFLDYETAKIDALIHEQERLIALLTEQRQAEISNAITGGLNQAANTKDSGISWLGKIPEHWQVIALKRLATVQCGVAKGKDYAGKATVNAPYLRVANVQDGYLDLSNVAEIEVAVEELHRYLLKDGDVLMNEGGDFDKLGRGHVWRNQIENCIHQNHVFAVRPNLVSSEWLNAVTGSVYAQFYFMTRSKQSTNLASISSSNIMELPVLMPPEVEQAHILSHIKKTQDRIDQICYQARKGISLLKERRAALVSAAVTGKIDVRSFVAPDIQ